MSSKDVVIIGNGILGLSIAHALSILEPNLKITIIGPENRSEGASIASGAMLNCFAEITNRTFKSHYGRAKFNMAYKALKMWPSSLEAINNKLPKDLQIKINPGTYVILNSESGSLDTENYLAIIEGLKAYNEPFEHIDNPSIIHGIDPIPNNRPLQALFLKEEGSIDSNLYIERLSSLLKMNPNISFIDSNVEEINFKGDKAESVLTSTNEIIYAKDIVIANGAYAQNIIDKIPSISSKIPKLLSGVGYSVVLTQCPINPVRNVIRTPNRAGACGLHALPRKENLYVGATNNVYSTPGTKPSAGLINFLLECTINQINQSLYSSRIESIHVGNRPATIDGFPLIGKTSIEGLWLLTGTYRDGFHQSPLLSSHIANLILGKEGLIDEEIFAPERNLIETFSKEESINEYVSHYIAGTYEHNAKLPKFMLVSRLESMVTNNIKQIYDELDTDYGLTPDMLLMFEFSNNREALIKEYKEYFANYNKKKVTLVA